MDAKKYKPLTLLFDRGTPDWYMDILRGHADKSIRLFEASMNTVLQFDEAKARGIDVETAYNCENAMELIREFAVPYLKGKGLDVGCGKKKVLPDAIGIDSGEDYGETREEKDHGWDDERDAHDLSGYENMDYVFSSHCLEHVDDWEKALAEWCRVLRPGGTLFLYLPWAEEFFMHSKEFLSRHKHNFTPDEIASFLEGRGMDVSGKSGSPDRYGNFVILARKEG